MSSSDRFHSPESLIKTAIHWSNGYSLINCRNGKIYSISTTECWFSDNYVDNNCFVILKKDKYMNKYEMVHLLNHGMVLAVEWKEHHEIGDYFDNISLLDEARMKGKTNE
jgi:hypothetical protein